MAQIKTPTSQNQKEKKNLLMAYGTNQDTYKTKPGGEKKPTYGTNQDTYKPKPEGEEKPNYGTNQDTYKPKPEGEEKPTYGTNQDTNKPKPEGEEKPNYGTNQDTYKPKPEEKEKSGYNRNSYVVKPKPDNYKQAKPDQKPRYGKGDEKPSYGTKSEAMKNSLSSAVQGTVLCKTGSKYYPIQGALATITCKAVDEVGVEKTISFCSKATDAKGYFFIPLSGDNLKLRECKAYLKSCPLATCNVPTNVNKAIEGALLSAFRVLNQKKTKLYLVGPFFYTSQATPAPTYGVSAADCWLCRVVSFEVLRAVGGGNVEGFACFAVFRLELLTGSFVDWPRPWLICYADFALAW
ncbi:putative Integrase-type DNA-binding superfamily protein [Hibiscus syriacus]|uniref:Integrase-type DNA-binding superfamily protein n=1 Tax=Hibiscus syriacus TaxID=106335 RepID=A0A6A2XMF9_HIBSY|nr:putative Integrase-type DNA-binding superfamily protein [Hibiscus syriacus]